MKNLSPQLKACLNQTITTLCHCCTLTRRDGTVLGFTDHDHDITLDGVRCKASTGVEIGSREAAGTGGVGGGDIVGALNAEAIAEADIAAGRYDDATLDIHLVDWSENRRLALLQHGVIGRITRTEHGFNAELRGPGADLAIPQGRIFQRDCDARLGDRDCGIDLTMAKYSATASVSAVYEPDLFDTPALSGFKAGWFDHGRVLWISGKNKGLESQIESHKINAAESPASATHRIALTQPPNAAIAPSDRLKLIAGCDKKLASCKNKFDNVLNFRGFPFIPGNDVIFSYPNRGDSLNDGSSLFS